MPGPYSAGSVFLQVVPSFRDFQNETKGQAEEIGRTFGEGVDRGLQKELDRRLPKTLEESIGKADTTRASEDAGKKTGEKFGGAFRTSVKGAVASAMKDLGKNVDVGVADVEKRLKKIEKLSIKPELDSKKLAGEVATLEAQLRVAQANMAISLEARVNAAKMADDLAKVRGMVEAVAGKELEIPVRPRLGGAFETELQARIKALAKAIPNIEIGVDADTGSAAAQLAALRTYAEEMGKLRLGIDIPVGEALTRFSAIMGGLQAVADRTDVDVDVHYNAVKALAQAKTLFEQIEKTFEKPLEAKVKTKKAAVTLGRFATSARAALSAAMADLPEIDVKADTDPALVEIATLRAFMADLDEKIKLGMDSGEVFAEIARVQTALQAVRDRDIELGVDVDTGSASSQLSAWLTTAGRRKVDIDVDTGMATVRLTVLQRMLKGLGQNARGSGDDADVAANSFRGFNGVLLTLATLGPLLVPILAALGGGILALGTSAIVAGAALPALFLGFSGIGAAVQGLAAVQDDAEKDAASYARTMRTAARGVRDAQVQLERARESAAENAQAASRRVRDAVEAQSDAEEDLRRAQQDAARAQDQLTRARERAQDQLEDMQLRLRGGALAERQAVIDLFEAQASYTSAMQDPGATRLEREQASINYERARLSLEQLRIENGRMREESEQATRAGVEGSQEVVQAQEQVQRANEGVADAQERIADAAEGVQDALVAQQRSARDSQRSIEDAQLRLADAQENYNDALFRTGDLGSSAMQKLEEAMGKLGPAGQAFATFIFGLRDEFYALRMVAQEGFLPPLQEGLEALMAMYGPQFTTFIGEISVVLGELIRDMLLAFTNPVWQDFFAMVGEYAPVFLRQWGDIGMAITEGLAAVMTAAAPMTAVLGEMFVQLFESFAEWAATPEGVEAIQGFLTFVVESMPTVLSLVGSLVGALITLGEALAPYADDLMRLLIGFLDFIAGMDPDTLGAIVVSLLAVVTAFQLMFSVFMTAGGIAAAIAGLAGAAGTVAAVLGGVFAVLVLVPGLLYLLWNYSETFRNVVTAAWEGIQAAAAAVVEWWETTLVPAWNGLYDDMAATVTWWWEHVLLPVFDAVTGYWHFLATVFAWAWENVIYPMFSAFATVVGWIWDAIIRPTLDFVIAQWELVGSVFHWVFTSVLGPVFELLGAIFTWLWEAIAEPVLRWIGDAWDGLATRVTTIYDTYLKPVIEALGNLINDHVAPIFKSGVDAIGRAWEGLIDLAKAPVRFVVDEIINKGIVDNFNKLADVFGTSHIDHLQLPKSWDSYTSPTGRGGGGRMQSFATGGTIGGFSPTPTADNIIIRATAGEFMQPVSSVDYYGVELMEALRRRAIPREMLLPGFATGGLIDFGRLLQSMGFRVGEHPAFGGVNYGAHRRNSLHYSGQAIDVNYGPGGTSLVEQRAIDGIIGMARQYGLSTIWRAPGHFGHAHFDTGNYSAIGTGSGGSKGLLAGVGNVLQRVGETVWNIFESPVGFLRASVEGLMDKADDNPITRLVMGMPMKLMDAAVEKIMTLGGPGDIESQGTGIYDKGGIVPPGLSGVLNLSGKAEHLGILTDDQWDSLRRAADGEGGDVFDFDFHGVSRGDAQEMADKVLFAIRRIKRGGVYSGGRQES